MPTYEFTSPRGVKYRITGEGSREEAFRALKARIQAGTAEPQPSESSESAPIAFINRGISNVLGAPVDAVNAALGFAGLDSETPFGGSESIESGMRSALGEQSVPAPGEQADSYPARIGQGVGEAAGALLPLGLAGRATQTATGAVGRGLNSLYSQFTRAPVAATAAEIAAGGGAGAGGKYAEDAAPEEYKPLARGLGEIGGATLTGIGPALALKGAAEAGKRLPITGRVYRGVKAAAAPFTEEGARVRATDRIRSLSADPDAQAAAIAEGSEGGLTPAQITGDRRLMGLEQAARDADPELDQRLMQRRERTDAALADATMEPARGASGADLRTFVEGRRREYLKSLRREISDAYKRARDTADTVKAENPETTNAEILRGEIDTTYSRALAAEDDLWRRVPLEAEVPTQNTRDAFEGILKETPRAQRGDVPTIAKRLLSDEGDAAGDIPGDTQPWSGVENVNEVHGFYSKMREIQRNERARGNKNAARLAGMLAEAALKDLGAVEAPPTAAGRALNEARAWSRAVNETFNQGGIGKILGTKSDGGDEVPPGLTMSTTVGRGGARAKVAMDEIRQATGGSPVASDAVADYLRGRFSAYAAPRGDMNADRARDFISKNAEILDDMPALRDELRAAIGATRAAQKTDARLSPRLDALQDKRASVGAALEDARVGEEIQAVFRAKNPVAAARKLRAAAAKDRSGRALDGLKGALLQHVMERGPGKALGNPRDLGVMRVVLKPAEVNRLKRIAREMENLSQRPADVGGVIDDTPSTIISFIARTAAARQGAKAGQGVSGASLLTANFASRRMQKILEGLTNDRAERLLRDAVEDPELFRALLLDAKQPRLAKDAEKRLVAWLGGLAAAGDGEE